MFRSMRRAGQQLSAEETERVLTEGRTGVLAVLGDEGYPYAVPLNYVYRDGRIIFHCAKSGHKMDALRGCDKVSFCVIEADEVVPERLLTRFRSAIAFGRARVLEDPAEIRAAARLFGLKYNPDAEAIEKEIDREWPALACVEIAIEHMTGKEAQELSRERARRGE